MKTIAITFAVLMLSNSGILALDFSLKKIHGKDKKTGRILMRKTYLVCSREGQVVRESLLITEIHKKKAEKWVDVKIFRRKKTIHLLLGHGTTVIYDNKTGILKGVKKTIVKE